MSTLPTFILSLKSLDKRRKEGSQRRVSKEGGGVIKEGSTRRSHLQNYGQTLFELPLFLVAHATLAVTPVGHLVFIIN